MIKDEERHLFYLNKIKKYKDNVVLSSAQSTPSSILSKQHTSHAEKENLFEPTEEELMYFYDPQKEVNRYRELKEDEVRNKLSNAL
jgi:hypothetical protein